MIVASVRGERIGEETAIARDAIRPGVTNFVIPMSTESTARVPVTESIDGRDADDASTTEGGHALGRFAGQEAPLTADELRKLDAYWRAANYLSVGQIYLLDNPLLREPLLREHIKPRLLGHWGTSPGLNMLCATSTGSSSGMTWT